MSDTKTCVDCLVDQPVENFNWRIKAKNRRQSWCRSCQGIRNRAYSQANKPALAAYKRRRRRANVLRVYAYLKTHPCIICGEDDPIVLEFDHLDPTTKVRGVSEWLSMDVQFSRIADEIARCRVLCANCHRRHTALQQNWFADA